MDSDGELKSPVVEITIPEDWSNAVNTIADYDGTCPPVAFVCGPKNCGKSTFARHLLNVLLQRYKRVAYLDTDVGQTEFTPPGLLSLTVIDTITPNLAAPCLKTPERCFFFGDVSSKRDPTTYLAFIFSLFDHYRKEFGLFNKSESPNVAVPLVINTSGWVKGIGYDLLVEMLKYISPTHVVKICISAENKNLPVGVFWSDEDTESTILIEVNSARQDYFNRSVLVQKDARLLRDLRTMWYFKQCFPSEMCIGTVKEFASALAALPPFEISLDDVTIKHLHCQVPEPEIFYSLNATIVGLAVCSDDSKSLTPCMGLGIVRGIDTSKNVLYLITPVPIKSLEKVDLLLQGFVQIPLCLLQNFIVLDLGLEIMSQSIWTFVEEKMGKLPHFVMYAILEGLMIILLFIDGILSFISNELAKLCDLRIPCLLCTRIDHVLVHRNPGFYYNESICEVHKKDISSLAYCHVHKKLSDIRNMCDGCLLSFATEKDSDTDRYKSLVGILHKDIDCFVEDDPKNYLKSGKKDEGLMQLDMTGAPRCSCCGEPLRPRPSSKFIRSASMNAYAPTPSPRAPLLAWKNEDARTAELPHIRYTELKIMSDTDSEIQEDEDVMNGGIQSKEDMKAATVPLLPDADDINEDSTKTPIFGRGNRFFGIPLSDSAQASPRYNKSSRKMSMDRPDLNLEPYDINPLNESDGESILNRLKKQVRVDRRSLIALYMELDEERSASAVAANNAMAMITRLQAEKAAVQMEALQYQRMMEEQAEYDQEALQVMKDLILKREEEIKVLESDLEVYREKYGPIKKIGSEICEIDDEDYQELKSQSLSPCMEESECGSPTGEVGQNGMIDEVSFERPEETGASNLAESSLDFDSERSYLLQSLKDLEKNINATSERGSHPSEPLTGNENKPTLARELSIIRERLRAIEAESGFLKHAAMTLQKNSDGTKLLAEIAQHLRKLRYTANVPPEDVAA
ncbi:OLC1v1012895C1 [Oldenlandia corymbosa var. corymbosa]|uniref:OLC1v1012895C1 n=1 Tax=Oldenlandia corymbosa var. corymbosa TaxID=529605 RepID=A0AAV1E0G0_OLDCO|nr:OLC1v1012895C1 [Oldenlandia corymbosa var. corymbosa]